MMKQWEMWRSVRESWKREQKNPNYAVAEHLHTLTLMSGLWNYVVKKKVGLHVLKPGIQAYDSYAGSGVD